MFVKIYLNELLQIIISKPRTCLDHETLNVIIIRVIELAVGLL